MRVKELFELIAKSALLASVLVCGSCSFTKAQEEAACLESRVGSSKPKREYKITREYYVDSSHSGNGNGSLNNPFNNLKSAVSKAVPGTRIILKPGTYSGNNYFSNIQGEENKPIIIESYDSDDKALIKGGAEGLHFSNPRHLIIRNIRISHSRDNGINIDDGGSYNKQDGNIILENLEVHSIGNQGNHDGIKLSGIDNILIKGCEVYNCSGWASSGIDMVGCHNVIIEGNYFHDLSHSGVQAKGGSSEIVITGNKFKNAGTRAVHMGGSTGARFFRPLDVDYEARNISVIGNIFSGSEAPIAYTGAVDCTVANNLFYQPNKWIFRILQENVRCQKAGNGKFYNNIVYFGQNVATVNVGKGTDPASFEIIGNLFYSPSKKISGLSLPGRKESNSFGQDPLLGNEAQDFMPARNSPVWGKGFDYKKKGPDYRGRGFGKTPSVGHFSRYEASRK
jgi:polygalacturonase